MACTSVSYIHPGERTGQYRLGGDQVLVDEEGNSEISCEDYAIADLVEGEGHLRERVTAAGNAAAALADVAAYSPTDDRRAR